MLSMLRLARCYQVVTLITESLISEWRSLLMAGYNDEVFMTRSLDVMPKTTEQQVTVEINK